MRQLILSVEGNQHNYSLQTDDMNSALCTHRRTLNHRIDVKNSNIFLPRRKAESRRFLEQFFIKNTNNFNQYRGENFFDGLTNNLLVRDASLFKTLKKIGSTTK